MITILLLRAITEIPTLTSGRFSDLAENVAKGIIVTASVITVFMAFKILQARKESAHANAIAAALLSVHRGRLSKPDVNPPLQQHQELARLIGCELSTLAADALQGYASYGRKLKPGHFDRCRANTFNLIDCHVRRIGNPELTALWASRRLIDLVEMIRRLQRQA